MPAGSRLRLTYANVMATFAVFIALGGASYAALKVPKNSVGTQQIKKSAVTTGKIKAEAVTGEKVSLSTLGKVPSAANADFAEKALSAALSNRSNKAIIADVAQFAWHTESAENAGNAQPTAFAHVNADGTLDATYSKNVGAVSHPSKGVYCFEDPPYTRGGQVTPDASGEGFTAKFGLEEGGCGVPPTIFTPFVDVFDEEGEPEDAPFFVVFYG